MLEARRRRVVVPGLAYRRRFAALELLGTRADTLKTAGADQAVVIP